MERSPRQLLPERTAGDLREGAILEMERPGRTGSYLGGLNVGQESSPRLE